MQRLQANLYSVFLAEERDGPPNDADYLYDSDICMRELPTGSGRTLCESLKPDSLHVAQYLALVLNIPLVIWATLGIGVHPFSF